MKSKGSKIAILGGIFIIALCMVGIGLLVVFRANIFPFTLFSGTSSGNKIILGVASNSGKVDTYIVKWNQDLKKVEPFLEDIRTGTSSFYMKDGNQFKIFSGGFLPDSNNILMTYLIDDETIVQLLDQKGGSPINILKTKRDFLSIIQNNRNIITFQEYQDNNQRRCYISYNGKKAERIDKGESCYFNEDASSLIVGNRSSKGLTLSAYNSKNIEEFVLVKDDPDITSYRSDPEGRKIATIINNGGMVKVRIIDRYNASVLAESDDVINILDFGFSQKDGNFYYIFENEDGDLQLSTMDNKGSTRIATAYSLSANFSSDGNHLVYLTGDIDGEMVLTVHPMSSGENLQVLDDEGLEFSILEAPDRLLIKSQNSDGLTVYTSDIDGKNLTEVYQEDDASLISTFTVPGDDEIFLITHNNEGKKSLIVIPSRGEEGLTLVPEWTDIQVHNRSPKGDYVIVSGIEDPSDNPVLLAVNVNGNSETVELNDDATGYKNAIFSENNKSVIYTAMTGSEQNDVEIREAQLNTRDGGPETRYDKAFIIDVQWGTLYPFTYNYWSRIHSSTTLTGIWDFDMLIRQKIGPNGIITESLDSAKWVVSLEQLNGSFSGEIIGSQPTNVCRDANINGSVQGNQVTFTIKYEGSCCFSEQMTFSGTRSSEARTMSGILEPVGIPHQGCNLFFAEVTAAQRQP